MPDHDYEEEISMEGQPIGDALPTPDVTTLDVARQLGFKLPYDRPWVPSLRPLGMRKIRAGCTCGGKFGYERYEVYRSKRKNDRYYIWLGQCIQCQAIYWCLEV